MLEHAVVGKQPTLSPRSTAKREPLPPTVDRRRHGRLDGRDRLRRVDRRRAGDPRRPVVRPRAGRARRRRRRRPGLARRERHDDRRAHEDPGGRLRHRLLDARGGRLRRAVRRDDERQLHGPHREAARAACKGPTIRRGARIGGGAILCPGVEIGEEAFVGAGAVVTKDVPARVGRRRESGAGDSRRRRGRAARARDVEEQVSD